MCTMQTKNRLHNTNRVIIAALTTVGLLMDGFQYSDVVFGLSVIIWVWLPECDLLEAAVLDKFLYTGTSKKTKKSKNPNLSNLKQEIT